MAFTEKQKLLREARWLQHVSDGTVYAHTPLMDGNPQVVEVTAEEAFPDEFPKSAPKSKVQKPKKEDAPVGFAGLADVGDDSQ